MSNESSKLIVKLQEENTALKIKVIDLDKKVFELEAQLKEIKTAWLDCDRYPDLSNEIELLDNLICKEQDHE